MCVCVCVCVCQRLDYCAATANSRTGFTVKCDRLRGVYGFQKSNCVMGGKSKTSLCNRPFNSQCRSTVKGMQLFCTNRSYLYRFNCISTVYMEMNCIGIVYRCTCLHNLVRWVVGSSSILLYLLTVSD